MRLFDKIVIGVHGLLFAWIIIHFSIDPQGFANLAGVDGQYREFFLFFEHATVLVLIIGILAGLFALKRCWHIKPIFYRYWIFVLLLGYMYFAGEECSWGQWYFHWETFPFFINTNTQGETNLHNIYKFFNHIPKTGIELFILFFGVLVPLYQMFQKKTIFQGALQWLGYISVTRIVFIAGISWFIVKVLHSLRFIPSPLTADNTREISEFFIAWFLMWYMIAYCIRFRSERIVSERDVVERPGGLMGGIANEV